MRIISKTMTKSMTCIFVCTIILVQLSSGQEKSQIPQSRSLVVELNKNSYFLYEPIFAHFKIALPIGEKASQLIPYGTSVKITFRGETKDFGILSRGEAPQFLPEVGSQDFGDLKVENQQTIREADVNLERIDELFPTPGSYQIQFIWHGSSGEIESNLINISIGEPTEGIEKRAFEMLKEYKDPTSFNWILTDKNGLEKLQKFVAEFGDSVYGERAIRCLANVYLAKDELDKAEVEFERIRLSKNKPISNGVDQALKQIELRRMQLRKSN